MLNFKEWLCVFVESRKESYSWIGLNIGKNEKTVREAYQFGKYPKRSDVGWELATNNLAFKELTLPWPLEAQDQVVVLRNLFQSNDIPTIRRSMDFGNRLILAEVLKWDPAAIKPSRILWGQALVTTFYIAALTTCKKTSSMPRYSLDDFEHVANVSKALLDTVRDELWAEILAMKIDQLLYTAKWNRLDPKSDDRRQFLDQTDMRVSLRRYNDLIPFVEETPYNMLAIASRFRERETYEEIHQRLVRANSDYLSRDKFGSGKDLDEDLVDFLSWADTTGLFHLEDAKCA